MRDPKKTSRKDMEVIRQFVATADPLSLGSFPEDEYSGLEFDVYRLLLGNASVEQIAGVLSSGKTTTEKAQHAARQLKDWWERTREK